MSKEIEEWRDIKGYEGLYQVSNKGNIKSVERNIIGKNQHSEHIRHLREKILKPFMGDKHHLKVRLRKNEIDNDLFVHRLVSEAFIPNPNNYDVVHHIDNNPENNSVENLEWMNGSIHTATHNSKQVYQYTLDGELVGIYPSASEAARDTGFKQSNISRCCNGGYTYKGEWINYITYKGYKWSYEPL